MRSQNAININSDYRGPKAKYLGNLPNVISKRYLQFIELKYARVIRSVPNNTNLRPIPLRKYNKKDYTISFQMGIFCYHIINIKMEENIVLKKWNIYYKWHLWHPEDLDLYRRIFNPNIIIKRRGRPPETNAKLWPTSFLPFKP